MKEYNILNIDLQKIGEEVRNGKIIVYPTDTVYGLAGNFHDLNSIKKIYSIKERNFNSPLIALISDIKYVSEIAFIDDEKFEIFEKLAKHFWPGGLTIILNKKDNVPAIMVSNGNTVGVRIPNLQLSIDIIESCGGILPTTSANISGEKTPKSFNEISEEIKKRCDLLIDAGECKIGEASTIIDLTKKTPKIIREGVIKKENLEKIIGKIER